MSMHNVAGLHINHRHGRYRYMIEFHRRINGHLSMYPPAEASWPTLNEALAAALEAIASSMEDHDE